MMCSNSRIDSQCPSRCFSVLPLQERRTRARAPIRMPVHIMAAGQHFECVTKDLSCEGIYMLSDRQLPHGSVCVGTIALPGLDSGTADAVQVTCTLEVVRSEQLGSGFGIACRIRKYAVTAAQRYHS